MIRISKSRQTIQFNFDEPRGRMNEEETMDNRRHFLKQSLAGSAIIGLGAAVPDVLLSASWPAMRRANEKILVVVQLSGGNDGLNTIIPYGDDQYYKNRFRLAIGKSDVLKIDEHIGFHPSMSGMQSLLQDSKLAIVQGVGYPNPNRSHFESMDLWHSAHRITSTDRTGWLGRLFGEKTISKAKLPMLHFGDGLQPLALRNEATPVPSIQSIDDFNLKILNDRSARALITKRLGEAKNNNALLAYVHQSAEMAIATSHRMENISDKSNREYDYPQTALGRNLASIAKLIGSGLGTQIYYTTLDGFDTHSNQAAAHQGLLQNFSSSISAFQKEMESQGNADRVVTFGFSEFGRRVRENASAGTDHGTAAPVFLIGNQVKSGALGKYPDLLDLDEGDVKYDIDYRCVYASLLKNWLAIESDSILGRDAQGKPFEPIPLFKNA